jgi:hypothetical protein
MPIKSTTLQSALDVQALVLSWRVRCDVQCNQKSHSRLVKEGRHTMQQPWVKERDVVAAWQGSVRLTGPTFSGA